MIDQDLYKLSDRIKNSKARVATEEATKHSFVMPFLKSLGYDVFDPDVIIPEYIADIGKKKGEKVDYAIISNGQPLVFIEVKNHTESLDNHKNQLIRYFNITPTCRFAILTNGIEYRFFSDLDTPNMMDKAPFLVIDLEKLKKRDITELERFAHESLNIDEILKMASANRYHRQIQEIFRNLRQNPTDEFVRIFATQITDKRMTESVLEEFRGYVTYAIDEAIRDMVTEKIIAIKDTISDTQKKAETELEAAELEEENLIVTTEEELQGYYIVRSLIALRDDIKTSDISYKDTRSYFGILYDNKVTKWFCRLHFNGNNKYITMPSSDGKDKRFDIEIIDDIYKYKNEINEALSLRL